MAQPTTSGGHFSRLPLVERTAETAAAVSSAVNALRMLGCSVREIEIPASPSNYETYLAVLFSEGVRRSSERFTGKKPALLPNLGGSLPDDCFTDTLGMPTVCVPHSCASCSQHAPNEHVLASLMREGLCIMTGPSGTCPRPASRDTEHVVKGVLACCD